MKCKECNCHLFVESKGPGHGVYGTRDRGHWCVAYVTIEAPNGSKINTNINEYMPFKEFAKVPEWCPKANDSYMHDGIYCKIVEIKTGISF